MIKDDSGLVMAAKPAMSKTVAMALTGNEIEVMATEVASLFAWEVGACKIIREGYAKQIIDALSRND